MFYCFLIGNNNQNSMHFNALTVKVRPLPPYSFPCTKSNPPDGDLVYLLFVLQHYVDN